LNTTIAFYFVTECSNIAVFSLIEGVSCHNAFAFFLDSTSLGIGVLVFSSVVTRVTG